MELHNLKPAKGAVHRKKRIARGEGSGHGGTSGKGHKGMKARSGATTARAFEGGQTPLQRRLPKFGFRNINRIEYKEINLDLLADYSEKYNASEFSPEVFSKLKVFNANDRIKILGRGDVKKALKIKAHACTASAKSKIEAAGGTLDLI
jgi:large subunit ribosomal protein L15